MPEFSTTSSPPDRCARPSDFGDVGRAEPVTPPDAIGADSDFAHRGVGHALRSQRLPLIEQAG